ncbi:alpha/beta hydrolase [Nocardia pseudobrasiliensis]|uniref:TAP-like protein n=1 Tax=Nocardia pseudobrasiliensis TaxID=45979 RepID=A0A370HZ10_9NOCA|nr:alpha/beta hydrolase [Nocardia pseudobrasiliensis]RDI63699.1 TAP-like protein [Nocardia pseudobrasiliensis]
MRHQKKGVLVLAVVTALLAAACGTADPTPAPTQPDLTSFYEQKPQWRPCGDERLDKAGAQCADITVPLNYIQPQGDTTTVAISRLAADPAQRRGVMLSNPGGPGGPGLDFTLGFGTGLPDDVRARYDMIGMDPRGIGRSSPVNCHWPTGLSLRSAGADPAKFDESVAQVRDLAQRCQSAEGKRLAQINTRNTARDMDVIRAVLGVDKISYFGTSYGTYLGAVYTQMFPERVDRFVLDSSVDPDRYGRGMFEDMVAVNERALDEWADWTAARDGEYRLGTTRSAVRATVSELIRTAGETPIRIGAHAVDDRLLPLLLFKRLSDPAQNADLATVIRQLADAAEGQQVRPGPSLEEDLALMLDGKPMEASGQDAVMCGDVSYPRDPQWYRRAVEAGRAEHPVFAPLLDNISTCAFWADPAEPSTKVRNDLPVLMIQATGDTRTTYAGAQAMHRALTGSRMVTLENTRIHGILDTVPNRCVRAAVAAYYRDATLPPADIACAAE